MRKIFNKETDAVVFLDSFSARSPGVLAASTVEVGVRRGLWVSGVGDTREGGVTPGVGRARRGCNVGWFVMCGCDYLII